MSNPVPQDRVRIFKRDGSNIAEFRTSVDRSWVLSDEGRAQFSYATRITDVVNRDVLQFGNWLLVENDQLPAWVGVIDTPRQWTPRTVTVFAYTPERVFSWRRGENEITVKGSAGAIFERLLSYVNAAEGTIIQAGTIDKTGTNREETVNPTPLNNDLSRIQERSLEEYQWRPETDALGRLIVYADWMPRVGFDSSALLHEGRGGGNVEGVSNILVEDDDIYNDVMGYGEGLTWASKPKQIVKVEQSISSYGLRQKSEYFQGVTSGQALLINTVKFVSDRNQPKRTFQLRALNVGETFKYIGIGNTLQLRFQNIGFYNGETGYDEKIRIIGMRYNPMQKNKVELTVELYNNE
jgi:hypothetical protein